MLYTLYVCSIQVVLDDTMDQVHIGSVHLNPKNCPAYPLLSTDWTTCSVRCQCFTALQTFREILMCHQREITWVAASTVSFRTDTQITFSLHFTPLGIRLSAFVAQP